MERIKELEREKELLEDILKLYKGIDKLKLKGKIPERREIPYIPVYPPCPYPYEPYTYHYGTDLEEAR